MDIPTNRDLNGRLLYIVFVPAGPPNDYDVIAWHTDPDAAISEASRHGGIVVQSLAVIFDPREEQE